jgi:hypothetical protein
MVELLKASLDAQTAKEAVARLEDEQKGLPLAIMVAAAKGLASCSGTGCFQPCGIGSAPRRARQGLTHWTPLMR